MFALLLFLLVVRYQIKDFKRVLNKISEQFKIAIWKSHYDTVVLIGKIVYSQLFQHLFLELENIVAFCRFLKCRFPFVKIFGFVAEVCDTNIKTLNDFS